MATTVVVVVVAVESLSSLHSVNASHPFVCVYEHVKCMPKDSSLILFNMQSAIDSLAKQGDFRVLCNVSRLNISPMYRVDHCCAGIRDKGTLAVYHTTNID